MRSLESRIEDLESAAPRVPLRVLTMNFIEPGRGTVALSNLRTGQTIERRADESEAQFHARAEDAGLRAGRQ